MGSEGPPRYVEALRRFVADLGLGDAVDITGSVTDEALAAHFRAADVFVSASQHEGFGVPFLEAMAHGVPVVCTGGSAVDETVGGAGLVLADRSPSTFATAVHRVLTDAPLRAGLVAAGHARVADFGPARTAAALRWAVDHMLAEV